jgi:integrating conjugative element protein (TIGR03746 family)
MNFIDQVKNIRFEQKISYGVIFVLLLVVVLQSALNTNIADANNRQYTISIPPSLEFGAKIKTGDVSKFDIHQFGGYIEQQLYFWQSNGAKDFRTNIDNLNSYITPAYRKYLLNKYTNLLNLGELTGREKSLQPLHAFDESFVSKVNGGWIATIDYQAQEHIDSQRFKNKQQRHFIKIVKRDINPELNPWGLQLDIPPNEPLELKQEQN